ncbi:MAG: VCBS repeat-containing protein [Fidelibacterota bacterium]|nr:MAG: VCBS repeat-containing protein [Candidatus Neomarinimicrobiota bacterium]
MRYFLSLITVGLLISTLTLRAQGLSVVSIHPAQNALHVPLDATISVTFSEDINPASISAQTFIVRGSYTGTLSGSYSYSSVTQTAVFTPATPLMVGEHMSATLTQGIQTPMGDPLLSAYTWSFTTLTSGGSGNFLSRTDYQTGTPGGIAAADINNDSNVDLVVVNASSNTVTTLMGTGDGTFQSGTTLGLSGESWAISIADINDDGNQDLAVAILEIGCIQVFLGVGNGTFQPSMWYMLAWNPLCVHTSDLNGDGHIDIYVSQFDFEVSHPEGNVITIMLGNGDGTFQSEIHYPTGTRVEDVEAADVDGDGDLDLVATILNFAVRTYLNNGDGAFQLLDRYTAVPHPEDIAAADLDGDGDIDLAVADKYSGISVLLGNGDGTFQPQIAYAIGDLPHSVDACDLDGDGDLDLAITNTGLNCVSIVRGNGDGTFQSGIDYPTGLTPWNFAAADLDGDGDIDLATANHADGTISVLFNHPSDAGIALSDSIHDFGSLKVGSSVQWSFEIYNHGGTDTLIISDILSSHSDFTLSVTYGEIAMLGTLGVTVTFSPVEAEVYSEILTIYSSDPDDPEVQIALSGTGVPFVEARSPSPHSVSVPTDSPVEVTFSNSMDPASLNAGTFWIHGNKGGTYAGILAYDDSSRTASLAPHELFAFGEEMQVVLTEGILSAGGISLSGGHSFVFTVTSGSGSLQYSPGPTLPTGVYPFAIESGDLNGDGYPDLVVANSGDNTISIFVNDQEDGIMNSGALPVGANPQGIALGDIDADGDMDIAVANNSANSISLWLNDGDTAFSDGGILSTELGPRALALSDLNNDSWLDMVSTNLISNSLSIFYNDGGGSFAQALHLASGSYPNSLVIQDVNNDFAMDILVANRNSDGISVYVNTSGGFNSAVEYATGPGPSDMLAFDVDGDGDADIVTADAAADSLSILYNNGNGVFETRMAVSTGDQPIALTALDGDADSDLDIAVVNFSANSVMSLANDGVGNFATLATIMSGGGPKDIVAIDLSGRYGIMDLAVVNLLDTSLILLEHDVLRIIPEIPIPSHFALHPSYPNPFNPTTTIRLDLPKIAKVELVVYNILGQEVATLVEGVLPAGSHSIIWEGKNAFGDDMPSGIYIAVVVTPEFSESIKMVLLE